MEHKLETNQYPSMDDFVADAKLVFDNCKKYNSEGTAYHKAATKMERYLKDQLAKLKLKKENWTFLAGPYLDTVSNGH